MLDHVRHTDQLPDLIPAAPPAADTLAKRLTPADFYALPYTPALLLPLQLDQAITNHKEYQEACQWGFDFYFEEMHEWNETHDDLVFVEHIYTRREVLDLVAREMKGDMPHVFASLPCRVGVVLGTLSALALTDFPLAQVGVHLLLHLATLELARSPLISLQKSYILVPC